MSSQYRLHLQHPTFHSEQQDLDELIQLALIVAQNQRGEDFIQPVKAIQAKLEREQTELTEAIDYKTPLDAWSEVADIVYYATQMFAHNCDEIQLHSNIRNASYETALTVQQAYICALAKYRLRAHNPKNFARENEAIASALANRS
jgi:hypothetical protein